MYIADSPYTITFEGTSTINFINNLANTNGGVMYIDRHSSITFAGSSAVNYIDNNSGANGGVMYLNDHSTITFEGNSTVNFTCNKVNENGGVMYIDHNSTIAFEGSSTTSFTDNVADGNGGVMYIADSPYTITFEGTSTINFINNLANTNGGVMYIDRHSSITFAGSSAVNYIDNNSSVNGGVMYLDDHSTITFKGNSTSKFYRNHANNNGGVMYIYRNSSLLLKGMARVAFNGNKAYLGGSVYVKFSYFVIDRNSSVIFINSTALQNGGAIYLRDQSEFELLESTFNDNSASDYGGAIYVLYDKWTFLNFSNHTAYFKDNTAGAKQNSVYINVDKSCYKDCFLNSISDISDIPLITSPNRLVLYNPTKCISGNETDCDTYYMNNVMLGQDITFDACLLDCYDQPTKAAEFLINGENHQDYNISNSKYITISCNQTTQGITVNGNLQSNNTYNYSINISLY